MTKPIAVGRWQRSALLCLFFAAMAQAATAQGIAGSFAQLQVLVKPGDTVTLTDESGKETTGKIAELSPSTLALLSKGARLELRESDIMTIKQLRTDSLADGAIYGAAVGAGLAAALMLAFEKNSDDWSGSDVAIIAGAYTAIGTGVGVVVDALIRKKHVIYQRPPTSGLQVAIAPWLTSQRKGVAVTLRF